MKPNLFKQSTTVVAEPKIEPQEKPSQKQNILAPKQQQTKQTQTQQPVEKPKINLFSAKTFEDAAQQADKFNILNVKKVQMPIEQEQQIEQHYNEQDIIEQFVEFNAKPKANKKAWKFRLKLVAAVYCATIAVLTGWVTANAIRINNMNKIISSTQTQISLNEVKFINEIQKLDDIKNQEPDYNNSQLIPISQVIGVTPLPLEDITEYEKQSNWFDNIVNWFGNLFGG
jgi:hypothetical protein